MKKVLKAKHHIKKEQALGMLGAFRQQRAKSRSKQFAALPDGVLFNAAAVRQLLAQPGAEALYIALAACTPAQMAKKPGGSPYTFVLAALDANGKPAAGSAPRAKTAKSTGEAWSGFLDEGNTIPPAITDSIIVD